MSRHLSDVLSIIAVLVLAVVPLAAAVGDPPPDEAAGYVGEWEYVDCNNGGYWIWCGSKKPGCGPCGEKEDGSYACFGGGSSVSNLNKGYIHDAIDYGVSDEAGGCSSCGAAAGGRPHNSLENLRIARLHRSRPGSYAGSFGSNVYASWDMQITLEWTVDATTGLPGAVTARLFDPEDLSIKLAFTEKANGETLVDGVLRDPAGVYRDMRLLAGDGSLTADGTNAVSARLTANNGRTWTFAIINVANSTVTRQGRLVESADRNGQIQTSIAYRFPVGATLAELGNDRQRLWQVATVGDAFGHIATVTYDNAVKHGSRYAVSGIALPNGAAVGYAYTGANLTSVTHPTGEATTISVSYDTALQKTKWVIDDPAAEAGHQRKTVWMTSSSWKDPATGAVKSQPSGLTARIDNGAGETMYYNRRDPANAAVFYIFQAGSGYLRLTAANSVFLAPTEVARASSSVFTAKPWELAWTPVRSFSYTGTELRSGSADALGRKWAYTVDQKTRHIAKTVHPDGATTTDTVNGFVQPLTETDELGRVVTSTYDAQGNRLTRSVGAGAEQSVTTWTYNVRGQVESETDPRGNRTDYGYDALGQLITITEPADLAGGTRAVRSFAYDSAGRLKTATDAGGRVVTYDYDDRNRVVRRTYADTSVERIDYAGGLVMSEFDRNGIETRYGYDAAGRRVSTTRAYGRPEAQTDTCAWVWGSATLKQACVQAGERTDYGYDSRYRLVATTRYPRGGQPLSEWREFDLFDRLATATDIYGRRTRYVYDVDDRVTRTVRELKPGAIPAEEQAFAAIRDAARTSYQLAGYGGLAKIGSATAPAASDVAMTATAYGVNGTADAGSLWSRQLAGDGTLTVRLNALQAGPVAMCGIMLRGGTAGNAPMASVYLNPQQGTVSLRYRGQAGQASTSTTLVSGTLPLVLPRWLRLVRTGDIVRASTSLDGTTWTTSAAVVVRLPLTVEAGCFMNVVSGVTAWPVTAGFDNLSCTDADWAGQSPARRIAFSESHLGGLDRAALPEAIIEDQTFDAAGQLLTRTDGRGIVTAWAYDSQGRVTGQTEAAGIAPATTRYAYDAAGNRTAVTSPRGVVTSTAYTGRNLVLSVTEAAQDAGLAAVVRLVAYSPTRKPLTETDALGRTTMFSYGTCCDRLVRITDPAGFTSDFTYDFVGNRITVKDGNGLVTTTHYDGLNRPDSVTNAAAEVTQRIYDDNLLDGVGIDAVPAVAAVLPGLGLALDQVDGSAVAVRDAMNATTYELRDGLGRTVATIDALGHATRVAYDSLVDGLAEQAVTDAAGHVTRSRSDGAGRIRQQVDAQGHVITAVFDASGNQVSQRDELGLGWDAIYAARGFLLERIDTRQSRPGSKSWSYDLDGNRLSETDATGKAEFSTYDARNRRVQLADSLGGVTRFAYDAAGNLVQISDADNESRGGLGHAPGSTQYAYDARNLLVAEAFPEGAGQVRTLRTYAYDGGRRLTVRKVGRLSGAFTAAPAFVGVPESTSYGYDSANRLRARGYADGKSDAFVYDPVGRLRTASSARYGTTVQRVYDPAGRLMNEALTMTQAALNGTTVSTSTFTVGYGYSIDNQLTDLRYPTGMAVRRTYTARHELETVLGASFPGGALAPVTARRYDASGRLVTATAGNGLVESRTYEAGSPLVSTIGVPSVSGFAYTYDAAGRKLTETAQAGGGQTFAYDPAGRVTAWTGGASAQSWDLTLVGDWRSVTRDGVREERAHTAVHETVAIGGQALTYDVKGNLTLDEHGIALAWDPENRLIRAVIPPDASDTGFGAVATYRYDALGRRVSKTVQDRTTFFLPAGAQTVVELERVAVPSQAQVSGNEADGTATNAALAPASGGVLSGAVTRINFQPATTVPPAGFLADTGKVYGVRTNGKTYGWSTSSTAQAVVRHGAVPLVEYDTFVQAQPDAGDSATWSIALPNGTYPVIVVAGDARSTEQTNNLAIGDQTVVDQTPSTIPAYEAGNFDGYAVQATVSNGVLSIAPATGAYHAKLCFVEIGAAGATITQATRDRLAAMIARANAQTGASPEPMAQTREFVYGSYVDEVLCYQQTVGGIVARYYPHYNHLYSVAALTDSSGAIVERYTYDAYGRQTITSGGGVSRSKSAVGWDRGFTGYITDNESGYLFARNRMYSPVLGRYVSRDSAGYIDGYSLYQAYLVPNKVDPFGLDTKSFSDKFVEIVSDWALVDTGRTKKSFQIVRYWTTMSSQEECNKCYEMLDGLVYVEKVKRRSERDVVVTVTATSGGQIGHLVGDWAATLIGLVPVIGDAVSVGNMVKNTFVDTTSVAFSVSMTPGSPYQVELVGSKQWYIGYADLPGNGEIKATSLSKEECVDVPWHDEINPPVSP